jgi:hypothetical protein
VTTEKGAVGEASAELALRDRTWASRGRADLYVALTRTTRRLGLVSHGEPPGGLTAVLDQPSGQRTGGRL